MTVPLHLGLEHPSLLWLVGVGLLAFVSGLVVNLYRPSRTDPTAEPVSDTE